MIKAADAFKDKTTASDQLWQTDFTDLKVISWGWLYLSTVLDDFSCYIVAWKLCTSMRAEDLAATLDLALRNSGVDHANQPIDPATTADTMGASTISPLQRSAPGAAPLFSPNDRGSNTIANRRLQHHLQAA